MNMKQKKTKMKMRYHSKLTYQPVLTKICSTWLKVKTKLTKPNEHPVFHYDKKCKNKING